MNHIFLSSANEDEWFDLYQPMLLRMVNTRFGRDLLCIPKEYPRIVLFKKNCVHCLLENDGKTATILADFRIGAQWGNLIRSRWEQFKSYARYFQYGQDYSIPMSRMTREALAMSCDTLTAYPDPHPETNTCDGWCLGAANASFSTIHDQALGDATADDGTDIYVECQYRSDTNRYQIFRSYIMFLTSSIGAATVTAAVASVKKTTRIGTINHSTALSTVTTSSATSIAVGDYNKTNFGSEVASRINYDDQTDGVYVDFTITDLTSIDKTGVTKYGLRAGGDVDNSAPSNGQSYIQYYGAETAGTGNDPKLVVTYGIPAPAFQQQVIIT